tara:strand:+ start:1082 stop:1642 length:561 start_codon:yes stop_codon:yes gene_type:complete
MKRFFDFLLSIILLVIFSLFAVLLSLILIISQGNPILFWSERVGRNNCIFLMPKFRTMRIDTPNVATHLLKDADNKITPIGNFLRKTSLDEFPQLFSILKGDMSFVGPRPALYNQYDLIQLRNKYGLEKLKPGLTGWAQVNGRDDISIQEKVELDAQYKDLRSFRMDLKIIFLTVFKVFFSKNISH